jgi:hypothetical protein
MRATRNVLYTAKVAIVTHDPLCAGVAKLRRRRANARNTYMHTQVEDMAEAWSSMRVGTDSTPPTPCRDITGPRAQ